jgi:hypothetical protein
MERLEKASALLQSAKSTTQYQDTAAAIREARDAKSIGASLSDACKGVKELDLQCGKFLAQQYLYARDFEAAIAASKGVLKRRTDLVTMAGAALVYAIAQDGTGKSAEASAAFRVAETLSKRAEKINLRMVEVGARPFARQVARDGHGTASSTKDDHTVSSSSATNKHGLGGWNKEWRSTSPYEMDDEACEWDRRDVANLSPGDFVREYVEQGKPVMLYGEGLIQGKAWERWARGAFETAHGAKQLVRIYSLWYILLHT